MSKKKYNQTCILILGMHRSGTSALTRVLSLMGAKLPKHIMGAGEGNETGHWEPEYIVEYNEKLLAEMNSAWHDWFNIDIKRLPFARREEISQDILEAIKEEYEGSPLFVLKDPRISRFAKIYYKTLRKNSIDVNVLIPYRNPLEVMQSLEVRTKFWPGTHNRLDAALLWLRYALEAEFHSRGLPRSFISFDGLLHDWKGAVAKLGKEARIEFPYTPLEAEKDVQAFLQSSLRSYNKTQSDVALDPQAQGWVNDTFEALCRLDVSPDNLPARAELDRVRQEFQAAMPVLQAMALDRRQIVKSHDQQREEWQSSLAAQTTEAENSADAAKAALLQEQSLAQSLRARFEEKEAELRSAKSKLSSAEHAGHLSQSRLMQMQAEIADLRKEIEENALAVQTLEAEKTAALLHEQGLAENLRTRLEDKEAELRAVQGELSLAKQQIEENALAVQTLEAEKTTALLHEQSLAENLDTSNYRALRR